MIYGKIVVDCSRPHLDDPFVKDIPHPTATDQKSGIRDVSTHRKEVL